MFERRSASSMFSVVESWELIPLLAQEGWPTASGLAAGVVGQARSEFSARTCLPPRLALLAVPSAPGGESCTLNFKLDHYLFSPCSEFAPHLIHFRHAMKPVQTLPPPFRLPILRLCIPFLPPAVQKPFVSAEQLDAIIRNLWLNRRSWKIKGNRNPFRSY